MDGDRPFNKNGDTREMNEHLKMEGYICTLCKVKKISKLKIRFDLFLYLHQFFKFSSL